MYVGYKNEHGENLLKKSYCAYFDILGFSEKIKNEDYSYFEKYLDVLQKELASIKERQHFVGYGNFFELKVFTDNFVLGYPWNDDGESELGRLFDILSHIQYNFCVENIFVRGAIALSDLFMDDNIVLGKALIEAYKLESEKAVYPRIIISNDVHEQIRKHISYYRVGTDAPQFEEYLLDIDGQYFLNYLYVTIRDTEGEIELADTLIQKHKEVVELNLKAHSSSFSLFEKYAWVAKYHNFFCDTFLIPNNSNAHRFKIGLELIDKVIARMPGVK